MLFIRSKLLMAKFRTHPSRTNAVHYRSKVEKSIPLPGWKSTGRRMGRQTRGINLSNEYKLRRVSPSAERQRCCRLPVEKREGKRKGKKGRGADGTVLHTKASSPPWHCPCSRWSSSPPWRRIFAFSFFHRVSRLLREQSVTL